MILGMVVEDATLSLQHQHDKASPAGVGAMAESMIMGQKYGLGVVHVCHGLSGLGDVIVRNTEAWIVTRFQGEDPRVIGNVLDLTREQIERIRILRPGEFVIFNPVIWPKPVYATFTAPTIPGVCDEATRNAGVERFFTAVTVKPPIPLAFFGPQPTVEVNARDTGTTPNEPPQPQLEMLVIIATGLPKLAGKVYELLGQTRTQGRRVVKALEKQGAICAHRFSTGRVGGQLCFFEILDPGWAMLDGRGLSSPKPLTNGGFEHELAARLLQAEAKYDGLGIEFEVDFGGVRIDAVTADRKTGTRTCFQIGISNPEHEVDSIEKFFALPIARQVRFVLIARDTAFAKQFKKSLKARKVTDSIVRRIDIRLIADLVKE